MVTFGTIVENLLNEQVKVQPLGSKYPEWKHKYTLAEVLEPHFVVRREGKAAAKADKWESGLATVLALAEQQGSGVKKWGYVN